MLLSSLTFCTRMSLLSSLSESDSKETKALKIRCTTESYLLHIENHRNFALEMEGRRELSNITKTSRVQVEPLSYKQTTHANWIIFIEIEPLRWGWFEIKDTLSPD